MSVLAKARNGGAAYIYSLLQGYEEPPEDIIILDDGVYYNKYMDGKANKNAKCTCLMILVEYADGTKSTVEQMSKDISEFFRRGLLNLV